jgi:DNA repair exonuclease SbcCD ATPase subunit
MEQVSKIQITNLFGIKERKLNGSSVELIGKNGVGKSSVIDSIRLALTNSSSRDYKVRKGETEGEILIETNTGLKIDRKIRTNRADYKSIKQNGIEVGSPETFLKDIFTSLQLNPVEFLSMSKTDQNATILNMIEYPWSLETIKEWFGEIPSWINYEQNILQILNDIQSEKGKYFQDRQDINRSARDKRAICEDIAAEIPANYNVDYWQNASTGEIYTKIERIRKNNQLIEKAKMLKEARESKVRKFDADRQIAISALDSEFNNRQSCIEKEIVKLQAQIKELETEKSNLGATKKDKLALIEEQYKSNVAKFDAEVAEYSEYLEMEPQDTTELVKEAEQMEAMKGLINEYRRMQRTQGEIEELRAESQVLTEKIEKARTLPGEILQTATIPIDGLTVEDGIPLIHGLAVSNLSDGEKLDLCVDVAIQKPNGLQIILIDGVEKLSTDNKNRLYEKCKAKGLQIIATRTTDDDELTVIEL